MDDPILYWNAVALELNRLDHNGVMQARNQRGPTLSSRAIAIIHIAMHDAYVLARAGLGAPTVPNDPYLPVALRPTFSAAVGTVAARYAASAVASAASVTMLHLYPDFVALINESFAKFCAQWGADAAGHRFGSAVGQAVVNLRQDDGANPDPKPDAPIPNYMESAARGRHREDPLDTRQGFLGVSHGFVRPFAVTSFHPLAKHPELGTPAYMADLIEVASKGVTATANGLTRSVDEGIQGIYWAYDGVNEIGTPPRLYNQIIRTVTAGLGLSTEQYARLFLLANVAMGDAGILAWFYKYHFDLWRPVIGIREHDLGMGPAALAGSTGVSLPCDPFWRPLGAPKTNNPSAPVRSFTPPFPAYPSGHATFGAAAFQAARLYLKKIGKAAISADGSDNLAFDFVSDELNGKSLDPDDTVRTRHMRHFVGLHQAMYENSVSRIYLGVHWRFDGTTGTDPITMLANAVSDNIGGVALGLAIANDIAVGTIKPSIASVKAPPFSAVV